MKINVSSVLKNTDASMAIDGELSIPFISYNEENMPVNSPIKIKAVITNAGDSLMFRGIINASLTLKCSRCVNDFTYTMETDFDEELSNGKEGEDIIHFDGEILDITDIVVNNILLSLPIKSVCTEDCKGLCPHCGRNLNIEQCNCEEEDMDSRFEVLKNFLKDN